MIVITGATGNIGSKTAAKLLAQGKKVKVVARNSEKLEELKKQGAEIESGDMHDAAFLTKAFKGAEAVFLIVPPNLQAENISQHQDAVGEAQIEAIKNTGVKNVVFISSQGAQDIENTGVVAGLGRQEIRLNKLPQDVNVLNIRASYFMENLFNQIGVIKGMGIMGSPVKGDLKMGMIATQDIAHFAAEKLSALDFKGKNTVDLHGDRDYSHHEVASIVGKSIGKPELPYVEFPFEDNKKALLEYGISESVADGFNNMYKGINAGLFNVSKRTEQSTTKTTLEDFTNNVFKYAMQ
ncbi:MAG: SDR family NAD(P)-dependent oxidoreductase [Bacteroidia bacterium]|nr:SDR family NAD(P)-dependent oxidoreductase [Bacteroidia bacterium]